MKCIITVFLICLPLFISKSNITKSFEVTPNQAKIKLLARLLESECSICPIWEKKLVGATVLNRMAHKSFPNTLKGVIYQPNQYYIKNIRPSKESLKIATQLLINNYRNRKVLYFYQPGVKFKRKNILIKTKYHNYTT